MGDPGNISPEVLGWLRCCFLLLTSECSCCLVVGVRALSVSYRLLAYAKKQIAIGLGARAGRRAGCRRAPGTTASPEHRRTRVGHPAAHRGARVSPVSSHQRAAAGRGARRLLPLAVAHHRSGKKYMGVYCSSYLPSWVSVDNNGSNARYVCVFTPSLDEQGPSPLQQLVAHVDLDPLRGHEISRY